MNPFTLIYQGLALALTQIRANKMRSLLTTLGIVIGVASVTAVIAALSGMRAKVLSEFEKFGTNKVFILPNRPDVGPQRNAPRWRFNFDPTMFDDLLQHAPSLSMFTRLVPLNEGITYQDHTVDAVSISGIEPSWHRIENRSVIIGQPFSLMASEQGTAVCLINEKLRDKLDLPRDPTGEYVTIASRQFRVIGVVEARADSSMFRGGSDDLEAFVPFRTGWRAAVARSNNVPFSLVIAAANSPDVAAEAKAEVLFFLRQSRHLELGTPDTFRVEFVDQFVQQFNAMALGITFVATGIVGVSLLVGGVGIMNIMLVSVSERTREIGLRKAVGARPGAILLQFLIEAVVLCFMGGAVGVGVGQLLTLGLRRLPGEYLAGAFIPGWAIALSFTFSAVVGLVFGMFPALKAARLDPIDALRHE
ncbi:MAG: ABC transporter permease [Tepidisphaeraceae bacterium]